MVSSPRTLTTSNARSVRRVAQVECRLEANEHTGATLASLAPTARTPGRGPEGNPNKIIRSPAAAGLCENRPARPPFAALIPPRGRTQPLTNFPSHHSGNDVALHVQHRHGTARDRPGAGPHRLLHAGSNAFREAISKHRTIRGPKTPALPRAGFIAPSASVIGDVSIGEKSSVWYGAVLRGDVNSIRIGSQTNIQDNTVIHVAKTNVGGVAAPTIIGDRVTVGHNAILHACTVKDDAFIGMGATVMDGAVVESGAMVAAGALVTPGTVVPTGQLWAGAPAKFMREMTAEEKAFTVTSAETYAEVGAVHAAENDKSFEELEYDKAARRMARERDPDYDSHLGIEREVKVQVEPLSPALFFERADRSEHDRAIRPYFPRGDVVVPCAVIEPFVIDLTDFTHLFC